MKNNLGMFFLGALKHNESGTKFVELLAFEREMMPMT